MSLESVLKDVGGDLAKFATAVANDWKKVKAAWNIISSPQTRAVILTISSQVIKTVNDSEAALAGGGMSISLDATVVSDIKTLITDAAEGEGVIAADLKALGVDFTRSKITTTPSSVTNSNVVKAIPGTIGS